LTIKAPRLLIGCNYFQLLYVCLFVADNLAASVRRGTSAIDDEANMTHPARTLYPPVADMPASQTERRRSDWELELGNDRFERRPRRKRSKAHLRGLFLLSVFGAGWLVLGDQTALQQWWPTISQAARQASDLLSSPADTAQQYANADATGGPLVRELRVVKQETVRTDYDKPESGTSDKLAVAPVMIATLPPVQEAKTPSKPVTPAPKAHAYREHARRVGLHPQLSGVLLSRLSKTDFKNARHAIATALSKTPDEASFTWPKTRKKGLAIFKVHFVPGAAKRCRRYVVTIEKTRWLTTALPMEKCGIQRKPVQRASLAKAKTVRKVKR
jgi:hypothetical protein